MEAYQLTNILNALDDQEWHYADSATLARLTRGDQVFNYDRKTGELYRNSETQDHGVLYSQPVMTTKEDQSIANFLNSLDIAVDAQHVKLATWYSNELDEKIQFESDCEQLLQRKLEFQTAANAEQFTSKRRVTFGNALLPTALIGFIIGAMI